MDAKFSSRNNFLTAQIVEKENRYDATEKLGCVLFVHLQWFVLSASLQITFISTHVVVGLVISTHRSNGQWPKNQSPSKALEMT